MCITVPAFWAEIESSVPLICFAAYSSKEMQHHLPEADEVTIWSWPASFDSFNAKYATVILPEWVEPASKQELETGAYLAFLTSSYQQTP